MRLIKRESARGDLIELSGYLEQEAGLDTAERFIDAAEQTFDQLAQMPQIGASRSFHNSALKGVRM